MMLATIEVQNLITSAKYDFIDGIFTENIPSDIAKVDSRTDVLITRLSGDPTGFGNNDFFEVQNAVEVQIFYAVGTSQDIEAFELGLIKLFRKNHWFLQQNRTPITDPDTFQITKTFYFTRTKTL